VLARVAQTLATAGARRFFVAVAEEGAVLRDALGPGPEINVFSGHMAGDAPLLRDAGLTPMLNSPEQLARHRSALPDVPYGVQLDSGMNRLGMEPCRLGRHPRGGRGRAHHARHEPPRLRRRARATPPMPRS
jgi:alanine racemase